MKRSFKNYGFFNISEFRKIIEEQSFDWDEFDFRQKKFEVHKDTQSIPLIFDEKLDIEKAEKTKYYVLFEKELNKLQNHLRLTLKEPSGYFYRAVLVKLPSGKCVKPHTDKGAIFEPRRIHLVLQTNPKCIFSVGEVNKNLKEGEIWEIDNDNQRHGVINEGETDRIHLIVDWKN